MAIANIINLASLSSNGENVTKQISRRPRRNRKSPALRASFQETNLSPANLVYPLFIHEGKEDTPIGAMPGCYRLGWGHGLVEEVCQAQAQRHLEHNPVRAAYGDFE
ncbi:hypothetical protein Droror1_Dr00020648 [Drosera rotundifolia]